MKKPLQTFWVLTFHKYSLSEPKASKFPSGEKVRTLGLLYMKKKNNTDLKEVQF